MKEKEGALERLSEGEIGSSREIEGDTEMDGRRWGEIERNGSREKEVEEGEMEGLGGDRNVRDRKPERKRYPELNVAST